jgi:cyclopropane fatty-acyl-phospholipid synthase-like methyltransferase
MAFLDPYNQYTCGYFKDVDKSDLNRAQENKMDLICRKIKLKSSDRVLDIGCGWGGLAKWISEKYGCEILGVNIADGQVEYAKKHISSPRVEIRNMDYRDVPKLIDVKFDKVVSIGMVEHVGPKNYRSFFEVVQKVMKPDGLFLLQNCGLDVSRSTIEPWIEKYIFPHFLCWKTGTTLALIMIQRLWLGGENSIRHGRNLKSNTAIDFIECFVIICFHVLDHFARATCSFIRLCIRLRECQAVTPQRDSWGIVLIEK